MCIYIYSVCMCVCMCRFIYIVCMCVYIYIVCVCVYIYIYIVCVCVCVCMCVCICIQCVCLCLCMCVFVCLYVCVYVYVYIYFLYIYIYICITSITNAFNFATVWTHRSLDSSGFPSRLGWNSQAGTRIAILLAKTITEVCRPNTIVISGIQKHRTLSCYFKSDRCPCRISVRMKALHWFVAVVLSKCKDFPLNRLPSTAV